MSSPPKRPGAAGPPERAGWLIEDLSASTVRKDATIQQAFHMARVSGSPQFVYMSIHFQCPVFFITSCLSKIRPQPKQFMEVRPDGQIIQFIHPSLLGKTG